MFLFVQWKEYFHLSPHEYILTEYLSTISVQKAQAQIYLPPPPKRCRHWVGMRTPPHYKRSSDAPHYSTNISTHLCGIILILMSLEMLKFHQMWNAILNTYTPTPTCKLLKTSLEYFVRDWLLSGNMQNSVFQVSHCWEAQVFLPTICHSLKSVTCKRR